MVLVGPKVGPHCLTHFDKEVNEVADAVSCWVNVSVFMLEDLA